MGSDADRPDLQLRVEAGAYRGKPVDFAVIGPWTRADRVQAPERSRGERVGQVFSVILILSLLVGGILQARRSVQRGHADTRGAWRVALYVFATLFCAWVLSENHSKALDREYRMFITFLGLALFIGGLVWVLYVALEPLVRRRWPDSLISWNRLLAGRFRDPRIGRDILIGMVTGVVGCLLTALQVSIPGWLGKPPPQPIAVELSGLESFPHAVAVLLLSQPNSIFLPMALVFLLIALQLLLRRQWLAVAAVLLLFLPVIGAGGENPVVDYVIASIGFGIVLFVLVRYGLLAAIAASFVSAILASFPATTDTGSWYAPVTAFEAIILAALCAFAVWTSLGGMAGLRSRS
jgi:serine/threonine-protein kinase